MVRSKAVLSSFHCQARPPTSVPTPCSPNVVRNAALLASAFNGTGVTPYPPVSAYRYNGEEDSAFWPSTRCRVWDSTRGGDGTVYCPGLPGNADACLRSDGDIGHPYSLRVWDGRTDWDPSAFTSAMVSISVGLQMFIFVSFGAFADFGPWRKALLVSISVLGSLLCILGIAVTPSVWWGGGVLMVLINISYGLTYVFYNGWLPLLASNTPEVLKASSEERDLVFMSTMTDISSRGFAWGYLGSVLCLLICVGVTIAADTAILAYRVNVMIAGIWWFVFALFTFAWLRPRPGPPLPAGENYLLYPWKSLYETLSHARHLKSNFTFLVAWFVYSDGFNVISSVGAQYANAFINWQPIGKSLGLAGLLLIVPIFAMLGSVFWNWAQKRFKLSNSTVLLWNNTLMSLVPAYGLLGFVNRSLGYRRWFDMYLGVILYGFNLGSVQSVSRSVYGSMIPEGQESRFYSLFEFTDKGSSWIGPAVVSAVLQATGNMRLAFIYPIVALLLPLPVILTLDYAKAEQEGKAYAAKYHTAGVASRGQLSVLGHEEAGSLTLRSVDMGAPKQLGTLDA